MADIAVTASTVIHRNVAGNERIFVCDFAPTTAAGTDTVATPLSVVNSVTGSWIAPASTVLTTAVTFNVQPSSLAGSILIQTSTHDNLSFRYRVSGR